MRMIAVVALLVVGAAGLHAQAVDNNRPGVEGEGGSHC